MEIVRADNTISNDVKEILERWHSDISKLFSGIKENPEMAFDEHFYNEILQKKAEFESFSHEEQSQENDFNSENINADISYLEVSEAIESTKKKQSLLRYSE